MKGFPNQVADLGKVATSIAVAARLFDEGANVRDDNVFGEALVRAGVAGRGRPPLPVDEYLAEQRTKPASSQSFRTTARGVRELLRAMGLTKEANKQFSLTPLGRRAAERPEGAIVGDELEFWRSVILQIVHEDDGGTSHPYQVLLRLVASNPGITRAKCALALEAVDDSPEELNRIVALSNQSELTIRKSLAVSVANWDNAKKVLPSFAEQLGDVVKAPDGSLRIARAPGAAQAQKITAGSAGERRPKPTPTRDAAATGRLVTPETIGKAGTNIGAPNTLATGIDAAAMQATIDQRAARLRAHNTLVKEIAKAVFEPGVEIYEHPFDILVVYGKNLGLLIEVKTLDGSAADEVNQVRAALSQLLYYEAFARNPSEANLSLLKLAFFDRAPSTEHTAWLNQQGIEVLSGVPDKTTLRGLFA